MSLVSSDRRARAGLTDQLSRLRGRAGGDPDIMCVADVAKALHCTVDAVRGIPDRELKAHKGPGKHLLYLREDVVAYVRALPRSGRGDWSAGVNENENWAASARDALRRGRS